MSKTLTCGSAQGGNKTQIRVLGVEKLIKNVAAVKGSTVLEDLIEMLEQYTTA